MPGIPLQTDAFVLAKREPTEAFQGFTVFSGEHGALLVMQRLSKKSANAAVALDLFDEVSLLLESSNEGRTWFVKEVRLLRRASGIGRGYEALRHASDFAGIVARNPVHQDERPQVATLLRTAFAAFESAARPDIVFLKSLYCFARDEGYPLKEQWFPQLTPADREAVATLLNRPLSEQTATAESVLRLRHRLEDYLRAHTEVLLE
jgi:hypothetical protein